MMLLLNSLIPRLTLGSWSTNLRPDKNFKQNVFSMVSMDKYVSLLLFSASLKNISRTVYKVDVILKAYWSIVMNCSAFQ